MGHISFPRQLKKSSTSQLSLTIAELLKDVVDIEVVLRAPENLRNRYIGLRHGQSEANVAGIISSDPKIGSETHGLTALGRFQGRIASTHGY